MPVLWRVGTPGQQDGSRDFGTTGKDICMNGVRMLQTAILLLLLTVSTARAQVATFARPEDPVPGAGKLTYLDLAREVVPDMKANGRRFTGTKTIDVPHADPSYDMRPPIEPNLDRRIAAVALGGTRHLLLIDLGEADGDAANYTVLALFDTSRRPRLLDALSVGFDRSNFFLGPAVRPLGAGQLITTASEHFNSSQTYRFTVLVLLHDGRLEPVDSIFTFGDTHCSFKRPQQLTIATDRSKTAFADVVATVTEHVIPTLDCGSEKPPEAASRAVTVVYRWDEAQAKYVPDSDAFDKLAADNSKRF
jgi:hypothetical protein